MCFICRKIDWCQGSLVREIMAKGEGVGMERKRNASEKPREITPDSDQIEAEQREKEEERNNRK